MRALAVAAVVGFHAFASEFPGGYIGVDVFFVISGFLISGLIMEDLEQGRFRFTNFYARRIRRIFPSLIVVLLACYAMGALLLLTNEFQDLCKYIASSALFSANFTLLEAHSYFDVRSEFKPLLHMWSLGIEEQFYIVWPLALALAFRMKMAFKYLIVSGFILSFIINMVLVGIDVEAAFYLPISRFFELMAGSGLACFSSLRNPSTNVPAPIIRSAASWLGLVLIVAAIATFNQSVTFPGWRALIPVTGSMLVIAAGPMAVPNRTLLSARALVWIGAISYPLYLWHWPLISFLRISVPSPSVWSRAAAVVLAVILSWASYAVVERRLRYSRSKWIVPALCAAIITIGVIGLALHQAKDFRLRGSEDDLAQLAWLQSDPKCYAVLGLDASAKFDNTFCHLPAPGPAQKVAIMGDSMANSLYPGLKDVLQARNIGVVNLGGGSCAPFRNLRGRLAWNYECELINNKSYAYVAADKSITTVILVFSSWAAESVMLGENSTRRPTDEMLRLFARQMNSDIAYLRSRGKAVVLNYDGAELGVYPRQCATGGSCIVSASDVNRGMGRYLAFWSSMLDRRTDVCVFHQAPVLSTNGQYSMRNNGRLVFRDPHHLSFYGSTLVAKALVERCLVAPNGSIH